MTPRDTGIQVQPWGVPNPSRKGAMSAKSRKVQTSKSHRKVEKCEKCEKSKSAKSAKSVKRAKSAKSRKVEKSKSVRCPRKVEKCEKCEKSKSGPLFYFSTFLLFSEFYTFLTFLLFYFSTFLGILHFSTFLLFSLELFCRSVRVCTRFHSLAKSRFSCKRECNPAKSHKPPKSHEKSPKMAPKRHGNRRKTHNKALWQTPLKRNEQKVPKSRASCIITWLCTRMPSPWEPVYM